VTAAHVAEAIELVEARRELREELDRLASYIAKSGRHRVKLVKSGRFEAAILGEIGVSLAMQRTDLVLNLHARLERLHSLSKEVEAGEAEDYEKRFSPSPAIREENAAEPAPENVALKLAP
jgi:hypothetical protein